MRKLSPQLLHVPAVLLCGPACAAVALGQAKLRRHGPRGSVVGEAMGRSFGPHALGYEPPNFKDPLPAGLADPDSIPNDHGLRCLHGVAVEPNVSGPASCSRRRTGFEGSDRPQPGVNADCRWGGRLAAHDEVESSERGAGKEMRVRRKRTHAAASYSEHAGFPRTGRTGPEGKAGTPPYRTVTSTRCAMLFPMPW